MRKSFEGGRKLNDVVMTEEKSLIALCEKFSAQIMNFYAKINFLSSSFAINSIIDAQACCLDYFCVCTYCLIIVTQKPHNGYEECLWRFIGRLR